jgi:hypothetical protein
LQRNLLRQSALVLHDLTWRLLKSKGALLFPCHFSLPKVSLVSRPMISINVYNLFVSRILYFLHSWIRLLAFNIQFWCWLCSVCTFREDNHVTPRKESHQHQDSGTTPSPRFSRSNSNLTFSTQVLIELPIQAWSMDESPCKSCRLFQLYHHVDCGTAQLNPQHQATVLVLVVFANDM